MTKISIFPHNPLENLNISYIVFVTFETSATVLNVQILEVLHNRCFDFLCCVESLSSEMFVRTGFLFLYIIRAFSWLQMNIMKC